jgi:CRP/FNR family cyclic AMP-dependent transcriptional regulator
MNDNAIKDLIFEMKEKLLLFHLLTNEEVELIIPYLDIVAFPKGASIFKEGEKGDFVGFISNGKLEVKKSTEFEGKQVILATLGRGSLVGELAFVDIDEPRTATVVALENSELVVMKRDALEDLTGKWPYIGVKILKGIIRILAVRLRKSTERLTLIF